MKTVSSLSFSFVMEVFMRTVVREIKRAESLIKVGKVSEERISLFERFKGYVVEGKYFSYAQHDVLFNNLFEEDLVLASKLCVSEAAVRKIRSNLSQALYKTVGYDIVDKILFGEEWELSEVSKTLDLAEIDISVPELFPWELLQFISTQAEESENKYEIGEFDRELAFLRKYLLKSIKTDALSCDLDKLKFVIESLKSGECDSDVNKYIVKNLLFK